MRILHAFMILMLGACVKTDPAKEIICSNCAEGNALMGSTASPATAFNNAFTQYGPGWSGGDQGTSVPLPDGTVLWLFGDSFIGNVNPDRSRPPGSAFIRNCATRKIGGTMQTYTRFDGATPVTWLTPPEADYWYWPQDGFVFGSNIYIWCITMRNSGSGPFGFEYVRTDMVQVDLASFQQVGRKPYPNAGKLYGNCIMETEDYVYIYGTKERPAGKQMVVSRIPAGVLPGTVAPQFWAAAGWSPNPMDALPMLDDLSNVYSVFPDPSGSGFRLICQGDYLADEIYGWTAPAPEGPFTSKTLLLRTPQDGGDIWTYNANAHTEFVKSDGSILVSWSSNSMNFADLFSDADTYRPWFAWVPMW